MRLTATAPAKVNLFLHVGPLDDQGLHPLASLVAFADDGDRLTLLPADTLSLEITGRFGAGLSTGEDNLIVRAMRSLGQATGRATPFHLTLDKRLPIASGVGGGTSDAGAALKLAREALGLDMDDEALARIAAELGADGPMCLHARAAWAEGHGERLAFEPRLPPLPALVVNPGAPSPTGAVYAAYDSGPARTADRPQPPHDWSPAAVIEWLSLQRNDLQAPAVARTAEILTALEVVGGVAGARLARMSGSGATVFGLFDTAEAAQAAASAVRASHPAWWVEAMTLS